MDKELLLKKWLTDELTKAELEEFNALEDADFNTQILENAKYFKASSFSSMDEFDSILDRGNNKTSVLLMDRIKPLLRIASLFVIGFAVYFFFFFNQMTKVATLAHEKTKVFLPDNSKVELNALSEITFNKGDWDKKREVNLKGEAYFKVAKGKVFDVITSDGVITVVGTQFNVKQRDHYFEVQCYEGIVKVSSHNIDKKLLAGDTFRFYMGKSFFTTVSFKKPSWVDHKSYFNSVSLSEVFFELERQYDIEITFDESLGKSLFTGGFVHDNLENALRSITEPLDLQFIIKNSNHVLILNRE